MIDDLSERATQPNGFPTELETSRALTEAMRERAERAERAYQDALDERDKWRERFMVLRSRLHGFADSLRRLESEIGRIIDEK